MSDQRELWINHMLQLPQALHRDLHAAQGLGVVPLGDLERGGCLALPKLARFSQIQSGEILVEYRAGYLVPGCAGRLEPLTPVFGGPRRVYNKNGRSLRL